MTNGEYIDSLSEKYRKEFAKRGFVYRPLQNLSVRIRYKIPLSAGDEFLEEWKAEELPAVHELKILPEYYVDITARRKNFELRKDDRNYKEGDFVVLEEWNGEKYTGWYIPRKISYILRNCSEYGLMDGYCILGLKEI